MKYKLINSEYNTLTGVSFVTIATPLGEFTGYAYLNEEDKNYKSTFIGCEIAENRAIVMYLKKKLAQVKIELRTLKNLEILFISLKNFKSKSREFCQLRKQIHIKEKEIEKIKKIISVEKTLIEKIPNTHHENTDMVRIKMIKNNKH